MANTWHTHGKRMAHARRTHGTRMASAPASTSASARSSTITSPTTSTSASAFTSTFAFSSTSESTSTSASTYSSISTSPNVREGGVRLRGPPRLERARAGGAQNPASRGQGLPWMPWPGCPPTSRGLGFCVRSARGASAVWSSRAIPGAMGLNAAER